MHDAFYADHAFLFTVENALAPVREHTDADTELRARYAYAGSAAQIQARRSDFSDKAHSTSRVVFGNEVANFLEVGIGLRRERDTHCYALRF